MDATESRTFLISSDEGELRRAQAIHQNVIWVLPTVEALQEVAIRPEDAVLWGRSTVYWPESMYQEMRDRVARAQRLGAR